VTIAPHLPKIDAARAQLQHAAIRAFNHAETDGLRLTASIIAATDRRAWISFDAPVAITPLIVDSALFELGEGDGVTAAAALVGLEPLIAFTEHRLGTTLSPVALSNAVDPDAILLRIETRGAARHAMIVALPPDATVAPPSHQPPVPGFLRLPWTAVVTGPRIDPERLARLEEGDLILLGTDPLPGRMTLPGIGAPFALDLFVIERRVTIGGAATNGGHPPVDNESPLIAEPIHDDMAAPQGIRVPIRAEIEAGGIAISEIAALGTGSVIGLPSSPDLLPVKIRAGDTLIGEGQLVMVGDNAGVLVTALHSKLSER